MFPLHNNLPPKQSNSQHNHPQQHKQRSHKRRIKRNKRQQSSTTLIQDIQNASTVIDNRLYFTITKHGRQISNSNNIINNNHLFCVDHVLRYEPFFVDFGPLNLGCLYKFCELVKHKLADTKYKNMNIIYYCDRNAQHISNACFLIGGYSIIYQSKTAANAHKIIEKFAMAGYPFRDASMGLCTYKCSVKHCLYAIYRSFTNKFLDFSTFDVNEYEHFEKVECGDLNIIIPNKFLAFAGPYYKETDEEGYPALTADFYLPIWKKFNVTTVIRLNKKCYDKRIFTHAGFKHYDLYFIDGTTPSMCIINKFLAICENKSNTMNNGLLAVHCKAGLGRTGSCIGCYLMKHYCWTAGEVIAWMRICRPGSVIGPQQQFLEKMQSIMWRDGDIYRRKHNIQLENDPRMDDMCIADDDGSDDNHNRKKICEMNGSKMNNNRKAFVKRYLENAGGMKNKENYRNNNMSASLVLNGMSAVAMGNMSGSLYVKNDDCKNSFHLATDPGMNQGQALKEAKAKHNKKGRGNGGGDGGVVHHTKQSKSDNFFSSFVGWKKSERGRSGTGKR